MARNTEVVRQWEILRSIDAAIHGVAVARLAEDHGVHERTIRRDLDALGRAGFPLFDIKVNGTPMWKLRARPFRELEALGLSLTELCGIYFGHAMMGTLAGSPLLHEAERAFAKIDRALPVGCRRFLDQLPRMLKAKGRGRKRQDDARLRDVLTRVLDATLLQRRAEMRYTSASSARTKTYVVDVERIAYADGGIYVLAYVEDYGEMRTFAAERISTFALLDERFERRALPVEAFPNSIGVHSGPAERVVIEFEPDAAVYVREREWHASQVIVDRPDGGIVVTMDVCKDYALRAWVLGFGPSARVVAPMDLAQAIFEASAATRRRYLPERVKPTRLVAARAS